MQSASSILIRSPERIGINDLHFGVMADAKVPLVLVP
jgi:hypothetical protein